MPNYPKRNGLNQSPLNKTSAKTAARNHDWKAIIITRAMWMQEKYGRIVCEFSSETIRMEDLASVPTNPNEAWGHHIDGNRNNCSKGNCYIVKNRHHARIHLNNIKVKQLDFQGACEIPQPVVRELE